MDAKDRTALGQQARATVAQGYDWENVTDQIERLYYDVCGTTGTRETLPHRLSREKNRVVRI
jgi:hypothetical protein